MKDERTTRPGIGGGAMSPAAKLTAEQVKAVRRRHFEGESIANLARSLGMSYNAIKGIVRLRTYSNIPSA